MSLIRLPARVLRSLMARSRDLATVLRYRRRAAVLTDRARGIAAPESLFDLVNEFDEFRPAQIRSEFSELLRRVRAHEPRASLEIGTATGGTAFLLSRCLPREARLVTLDIADNAARRAAARMFSFDGRSILPRCADSHRPETLQMVIRDLRSDLLDFLFVDGDHTFDGVAADFRLHVPRVRDGGLVAMHDIVPDSLARRGEAAAARTDGVPRFWVRVRECVPDAEEIVESPTQEGYGIGVLRVSAEARGRLRSEGLLE